RERERYPVEILDSLDHAEWRGRHAAVGENLLGAALVQRQRERKRIGARVRNVQVFAQRRDVRLAAGTVKSLRHVEDDVGMRERKFLRKEFIGFEALDVAEETQRLLDPGYRRRVIPLFVRF